MLRLPRQILQQMRKHQGIHLKGNLAGTRNRSLTDGRMRGLRKHLSGTRRLKSLSLEWSPDVVTTQVLPETLKAPDHVQLAIGKMLQKAVGHEPRYILPIVITFVGNFLLQDRAN